MGPIKSRVFDFIVCRSADAQAVGAKLHANSSKPETDDPFMTFSHNISEKAMSLCGVFFFRFVVVKHFVILLWQKFAF